MYCKYTCMSVTKQDIYIYIYIFFLNMHAHLYRKCINKIKMRKQFFPLKWIKRMLYIYIYIEKHVKKKKKRMCVCVCVYTVKILVF